LGWAQFHLLGHSRGAIIGSLLAAALPQRVTILVMLDALRPTPVPLQETFQQLGKFVQAYARAPRNGVSRYETFERALEVRCQVAEMSERAARPIVERGLEQVDGLWQWRADSRLNWPSAFKLSAEHNALLLEQLRDKPHLFLLASKGVGGMLRRGGGLRDLEGMNWAMLPGSHHFHMEDAAAEIAAKINEFWRAKA
jgi:pimeloyl-ACP methyl ester carboxylesterase